MQQIEQRAIRAVPPVRQVLPFRTLGVHHPSVFSFFRSEVERDVLRRSERIGLDHGGFSDSVHGVRANQGETGIVADADSMSAVGLLSRRNARSASDVAGSREESLAVSDFSP